MADENVELCLDLPVRLPKVLSTILLYIYFDISLLSQSQAVEAITVHFERLKTLT